MMEIAFSLNDDPMARELVDHITSHWHRDMPNRRFESFTQLLEAHAADHDGGPMNPRRRHTHVPCRRCESGTTFPMSTRVFGAAPHRCFECGALFHSAMCVDDQGHTVCVCGLDHHLKH